MKVRGQRECTDCGTRWSYYDTGSVECPDCGSLRSVGVESERRLHTDTPAELDLTDARRLLDAGTEQGDYDASALRKAADRAGELAGEYVRRRGFVRGGDLLGLDATYLAAQELRHAADVVGRGLDLRDDEEWYFLALLRGADADAEGSAGPETDQRAYSDEATERPPADEVPESMRAIRGLAAADAVDEYRREMADWADENAVDDAARDALETLGEHVKRVHALDGDVAPETADRLVAAARDVSRYLEDGDGDALANARDRFDRLSA